LSIIEALILGIIQGLTEFIPISSTGHLTLAGKFMNLISEENPQSWTSFIAVIQLGTLLSVLLYFWNDLLKIFFGFITDNLTERKPFKQQSLNSRIGWLIIIGTIPIVIIGIGFKDIIEGNLTKNLYVISSSLIILAIILFIAEKVARLKKEVDNISIIDSFIIGIAQALALIPGSSRSGTTITASLFLGLKRDVAARFSFLLSVPAIFASGILQLYEGIKTLSPDMFVNVIVSTIAAAISGYWAIDFLIKFLKTHPTNFFIFYRIILGIIIIILLTNNIIQP
jgi:undecaprenyl-diphosphatase